VHACNELNFRLEPLPTLARLLPNRAEFLIPHDCTDSTVCEDFASLPYEFQ
jgi:hypothetical protein